MTSAADHDQAQTRGQDQTHAQARAEAPAPGQQTMAGGGAAAAEPGDPPRLAAAATEKRWRRILWILTAATAFLYTLSFNYGDGQALTIWSVDFMDCFLEGRLPSFYEQTQQNRYELEIGASHSQFWYLAPAAIWNLPLWIAEHFFGANLMHPLALFWGKLWFLFLQILVTRRVWRLAQAWFEPERAEAAAWVSFSALFTLISAGYAGQNDLFWILFSLDVLDYYFRGNLRAFYGLSLYVALLKPFWIFPFLALSLLRDKRIWTQLLWCLSYPAVQFLHLLLVGNLSAHGLANPSGPMTLQRILLGTTLPTPYGGASLFLLLLLALYVWAFQRDREAEVTPRLAIRLVAGVFMALMLLAAQDFYRYVLPVPYLALLWSAIEDEEARRWSLTAWTLTEGFLAFFLVAKGTFLFQPIYMDGSALGLPPIDVRGRRFWAPWAFFRQLYESESLRSVMLAILILGVGVTYLLARRKLRFPKITDRGWRFVLVLRACLIPLFFFVLTLVTYFIPA